MSHTYVKPLALALLLAAASIGTAQADAAAGTRSAPLPAYQQECAACHMAYPPAMMMNTTSRFRGKPS